MVWQQFYLLQTLSGCIISLAEFFLSSADATWWLAGYEIKLARLSTADSPGPLGTNYSLHSVSRSRFRTTPNPLILRLLGTSINDFLVILVVVLPWPGSSDVLPIVQVYVLLVLLVLVLYCDWFCLTNDALQLFCFGHDMPFILDLVPELGVILQPK